MVHEMSIESSIDDLDALGDSLDQLAERIEAGVQDGALDEMADGLEQAEGRIAAVVAEADAQNRLDDPKLVAVKSDWLGRFERFFGLVGRARSRLDGEAELRLSRHRASDAYLKNQAS